MAFARIVAWKSPCTIRWVSYRSRKLPTDSAEDPKVELVENTQMAYVIAVDHIHFAGPDANAMREWYAKVLNARRTTRGPMLAAELPGVALIFQATSHPVVGTAGRVLDHVTFEVRGLAAFCDRLQAAGIKLDRPYTNVPALNIAIAFIYDPWGTYIELTEVLDKVQ